MTDADKKKIILLGQLSEFKDLLNANITTLSGKVTALENLIQSDSDGAINKFNEIVAFLANITDDSTLQGIVNGINTSIAAKYTKPTGGIPSTDMTSAVQASLKKADTALQTHQDISGKANKATTLAGYGITDAKIANGVITLGSQTIIPITSHQDISGKVDKVTGKGLSTNDYTAADKAKVDALVYADSDDIEALFS